VVANDDKNTSSGVAKVALVLGIVSTVLGILSTSVTFYRTSSAGQVEAVEPLSGWVGVGREKRWPIP
jgi:hypothetical protein